MYMVQAAFVHTMCGKQFRNCCSSLDLDSECSWVLLSIMAEALAIPTIMAKIIAMVMMVAWTLPLRLCT